MHWLRTESLSLLLALSFFTRIPVGKYVAYTHDAMYHAGRYFAVVGWLLALLLGALYWLLSCFVPAPVCLFLLMVCSVMLTGAFHEDGLADTADALGGGSTRDHKLSIMKDSRLGTYGVSALVAALVGKWLLLCTLADQQSLVFALCLGYPLSRALALTHVQDLPYATENNSAKPAKSMPFATPYRRRDLTFLLVTGGAALFFLPLIHIALIIAVGLVVRAILKHRMQKHIQGFTGDTLGAAQQIQELGIYLVLIVINGGVM